MLDANDSQDLVNIIASLLSFFGVLLTESGLELAASRDESLSGCASLQLTHNTIKKLIHPSLAFHSDVFSWCTGIEFLLCELSLLLELPQSAQCFGCKRNTHLVLLTGCGQKRERPKFSDSPARDKEKRAAHSGTASGLR